MSADPVAEAVIDLTVEGGYAALTVASICARAGVEEAEFRRRFTDAEDAFCTVLERSRDLFLAAAVRGFASDGEGPWRDQIRATGYAMLEWLASDMRRARFVFVEMLAAPERAQLIRDQGMELLFDLIDAGRQELEDPESMSRATAEAIGGAVYNRMHLGIEAGDPDALARMVPELMYSVVLPYCGAQAAMAELSHTHKNTLHWGVSNTVKKVLGGGEYVRCRYRSLL